MTPTAIAYNADILGESASWCARSKRLYWIDGVSTVVRWHEPNTATFGQVAAVGVSAIGMIAPSARDGYLACAVNLGLGMLDLASGQVTIACNPEGARGGIGWNDGKVDPIGRLWVGTHDIAETAPRGALWMLDGWDRVQLIETGVALWNGPAFSPTGDILYVSDSIGRTILAYDVQSSAPWLANARVFVTLTDGDGLPDGLTVDAEGNVWCAHWAGAKVSQYAPSSERLRTIALPATNVTSVAFGDDDLGTLYVTTARYGLDQPGASDGALYAVRPGVTGIAATPLAFP